MTGPLLVALAAILWATDALFRLPAGKTLDPTLIVMVEHVICVAVMLPWMLWRKKRELFRLTGAEWLAAAVVGIGGSAFATIFFTAAFQYANPSVVILLQKLQPIMVVVLAYVALGERPGKNFYPWAALALGAAIVMTFPDFDFSILKDPGAAKSRGILFSLSAAAIWAVSTVAGKALLEKTAPSVATFWRFGFGLGALAALMVAAQAPVPWDAMREPVMLRALIYMGLIPGLIAMAAYYSGMKRTPATVVTFVELIFPVGAVILNTLFLNAPLELRQLPAAALLLLAVTMISWRRSR